MALRAERVNSSNQLERVRSAFRSLPAPKERKGARIAGAAQSQYLADVSTRKTVALESLPEQVDQPNQTERSQATASTEYIDCLEQ